MTDRLHAIHEMADLMLFATCSGVRLRPNSVGWVAWTIGEDGREGGGATVRDAVQNCKNAVERAARE